MPLIPAGIKSIALRLRQHLTRAEGQWFDLTRRVQTSGYVQLTGFTLAGSLKSGFDYLPVRPSQGRAVLRDLPLGNHSDYTFVDLGSGKGRMLLIAAEFPFSRINGVEFAAELHRAAVTNIGRCRYRRKRCSLIESTNLDASDYRFPVGNLVVYLFNPFGPDVIGKVLNNLHASIAESPRHVVLIMLSSEFDWLADSLPWLTLYKKTARYRIYQAGPAAGG